MTAPPSVNTGFVFARPHLSISAVFNATVERILERLRGPPLLYKGPHNELLSLRVWPQDVVNEVIHESAHRPTIWPEDECHQMDPSCQHSMHATIRSRMQRELVTPYWWVAEHPTASGSRWVASPLPQSEGEGQCQDNDAVLVAWTSLPRGARVATMPRSIVGRACANRLSDSSLRENRRLLVDLMLKKPAMSCESYGVGLLNQSVSHVQFTSTFTRTLL